MKELLKKYRHEKERLKVLKLQLKDMNTGDNGFDNSVIMDYSKGFPQPQSIVGFDHEKYKSLLEKCLQAEKTVKDVETFINGIEDDDIAKYCFTEYYIKGRTWEAISASIGSTSGEQYPRRVICEGYLKKHKIP